jgi:predicted amidophosphoribosyltransferase
MTYGDVSQNLILAFKHGDRLDLAPLVVFWLFAAGGALIADADVVVPVPMHPGRLHRRRYNQAAVLARGRRHRPSGNEAHAHSEWAKSQGLRENHRRMIALTEAARQKLREQHMLLIDDVLTTGAAVTASTRALLSTRASQVDALTLARVI